LPTAKFKSLWPLPGGTTEYVNTLTKILEKVQKENPTYDELLNWFTSEYKLSGQRNSEMLSGLLEALWISKDRER
jgi:hypothetical protein